MKNRVKPFGRTNKESGKFEQIGWAFWCSGCKCFHHVYDGQLISLLPPDSRKDFNNSPTWNVSGTPELPTFSPSVLVYHTEPPDEKQVTQCHFYVNSGRVQFLSDCRHDLKGQTVDLPILGEDGLPVQAKAT